MENLYKPEEGFVLTFKIMKLFGICPVSVKNPTVRKWGYGVQIFNIMAILPSQLTKIYLNRKNLRQLMNSSFFTLSCIVYLVKFGVICFHQKKIENLFERLRQGIFIPKEKRHLIVLRHFIFISKMFSIVISFLVMLSCLSWIFSPFVDREKNKELLFAASYPFDTKKSPNYEITYSFQSILLLNVAIMSAAIDMLTWQLYFTMSGQLEVLKMELTNLDRKNAVFHPHSKYLEKIKFTKKLISNSTSKGQFWNRNFNSKKHFKERFGYYTKRHEAIISFVKDVTNLFRFGIVVQICISCIIICVTCFELTQMSLKSLKFYSILQYQLGMLIEIFTYMWQGNEITVKTSELKSAIYECAWTSIPDKGFRTSLCIVMSRMQKAVKLRVGCFFSLSIQTFLQILKAAYSFFVLLKQINQKKV